MDTGTSMEATAAAHHRGPSEPAARTPPTPAAAAPRARITAFFPESSPSTGTGNVTATLAVAQTPTTGTSTGEGKKFWQKHTTLQPKGLRRRQQLPNRQPLRLPHAARRCCPVRATSCWTMTGRASSRSPRRRGARSDLTESCR